MGQYTYFTLFRPICAVSSIIRANPSIFEDPYVWSDPEVFRPERWIEKPEAPLFTYGLGYRMCAGSLLANREIYLILMRMLNSFRITSVEKINTHPIHGNSDPTSLVAIPNKYKVKFIPKNKTALDAAISNFSSK